MKPASNDNHSVWGDGMPITDPTGARLLVYNTVVDWLMSGPPELPSVDVGRTFMGPPPGGYDLDEGLFLQMCDAITASLVKAAQRTFTLDGAWRVQHEQDVISTFINAVAILLIAAPMTPLGKQGHIWAMS
jgi:hypothetical protein